jgi:hypothetical protein
MAPISCFKLEVVCNDKRVDAFISHGYANDFALADTIHRFSVTEGDPVMWRI